MSFDLSIVKGRAVHDVIHGHQRECVEVVKDAYLAHEAHQSVNPNSHFLLFPEKPSARIIALPAHLGARFGVSGIKWIASYPENVAKGFPRASAVLVLNDYQTGYPFAILESSIISAARTAASAALAAQWLNGGKRAARSLGIVGTGLIARYVYDFLLATGWELPRVVLHDLAPAEAERFRDQVCRPGAHRDGVSVSAGIEPLLRDSDLIVFTTVAGTPHVHDPALFSHNPLVLHLSLRDLSPEIILASNNVVDDVDHVMRANTSLHLTEQRVGGRGFVNGTLAALMLGKATLDPARPRIFSPFGLGILDLAVGKWVHDAATAQGTALRIPDFFYELVR